MSEVFATWQPDGSEDLADGEALHLAFYEGGNVERPRTWRAAPTTRLIDLVLADVGRRLEAIRAGRHPPSITVLDYGTGTGFSVIELLKRWKAEGWEAELRRLGVAFTLLLSDVPTGWYAKAYGMLGSREFVRFHSLTDPTTGRFVPLPRMVPAESVDIAIASGVLHLIPLRSFSQFAEGLRDVLRPKGSFFWDSPDLGPAPEDSILFHDPFRATRQIVLRALANEHDLSETIARLGRSAREEYGDVAQRLADERQSSTPAARQAARHAAGKQIISPAHPSASIADHLSAHLEGEISFEKIEMLPQEYLDVALVPSNQRYLLEIESSELRRALTSLVMLHEVFPSIRSGASATREGYRVHWSFGSFAKA